MNDNIDIRMSNYLAILGNPKISMNFEPEVIHAMEKAVAIYAATTSKEYLEEYKRQQEARAKIEEVKNLFK